MRDGERTGMQWADSTTVPWPDDGEVPADLLPRYQPVPAVAMVRRDQLTG